MVENLRNSEIYFNYSIALWSFLVIIEFYDLMIFRKFLLMLAQTFTVKHMLGFLFRKEPQVNLVMFWMSEIFAERVLVN